MNLLSLPNEIIYHIISFLDPPSIFCLRRTCRAFAYFFSEKEIKQLKRQAEYIIKKFNYDQPNRCRGIIERTGKYSLKGERCLERSLYYLVSLDTGKVEGYCSNHSGLIPVFSTRNQSKINKVIVSDLFYEHWDCFYCSDNLPCKKHDRYLTFPRCQYEYKVKSKRGKICNRINCSNPKHSTFGVITIDLRKFKRELILAEDILSDLLSTYTLKKGQIPPRPHRKKFQKLQFSLDFTEEFP